MTSDQSTESSMADDKNKALRNLQMQLSDEEGEYTLRSSRTGCGLGSVNNLPQQAEGDLLEQSNIGEYCNTANRLSYDLNLDYVHNSSFFHAVELMKDLLGIEHNRAAELDSSSVEARYDAIQKENSVIREAVAKAAKDGVTGPGGVDRFEAPSGHVLPLMPGLAAIAGFDDVMQGGLSESTGLENSTDEDLDAALQECYTAERKDTKSCYYNSAESAKRIKRETAIAK